MSIVIVVGGAVSTLLTWPKGEPTNTVWFWLRLLGFPALASLLAYGLRLHYCEQETARLQAEDDVLAEDTAKAIQFAREPLAVLASTYVCAFENNAAEKIVARQSRLEAHRPANGKFAIRHTALSQFNQTSLLNRYRSCFDGLLQHIGPSLHQLPTKVPLEVHLQLPTDAVHDGIVEAWRDCWQSAGFQSVETTLVPQELGVMALDAWLDIRGGPGLEKFALFVAAQLHDKPPANSAEAVAALLLGWAPLTERKGLTASALLHRPVQEEKDNVNEAMSRAIQWGNSEATKIHDLWQTGLEPSDRSALMQTAADLSLGLSQSEDGGGIYDVDAAVGHAGVASAWLALALAVEHTSHTQRPQAVATRQTTLRVTVIQPATTIMESGQQG
ncbi:hypothetical protein [Dyella sp.]|uniref:hypothetical protein n=1 Tax=Dyella sp. TaxID=1869338 RepID=UPI002D789B15|nr:hypothetical protein [Dyella sp.]HET7329369.1 hypothetical protein [Dyella sp.]